MSRNLQHRLEIPREIPTTLRSGGLQSGAIWEEILSPARRSEKPAAAATARGWRGAIDRYGGLIKIAALGVIFACLFFMLKAPRPPQGYYTVDDGNTYFQADYRPPPFQRDGKEAVQAVLFVPVAGGTPFVGYLLRYKHDGGSPQSPPFEVKRPGTATWVPAPTARPGPTTADATAPAFSDIIHVKGPEGLLAIEITTPQ